MKGGSHIKVEKAIEISDAKIQFVSFVDKAANRRSFLITKADDGNAKFCTTGKILKADSETHYVTGIVYEPLVEDAHGNFMTEEEIRKAAYWFAKNGDSVDLQHSFEPVDGVTVVETYIAPSSMEIEGEAIVKGTWIMTAEVKNPDIWGKIEKGEVTGFSMGGIGKYSDVETDLTSAVEKRGILKKLSGLLGIDSVEKGEVKERYETKAKRDNFWNAFYSLQDTLSKPNWCGDFREFEDDDAVIREALTEFSEIIIGILAKPNVVTELSKDVPVIKSGKKISGKNRDTLQSIYDNLGSLLEEFSEEEKEDLEVTKEEVQAAVDASVKKALEATNGKLNQEVPAAAQALTAEAVQSMVNAAVEKALAPKDEAVTADSVQAMVTEAVQKAVEPVLKARGLSSNLNNEKPIEKTENRHYLAGIL